MINNLITEHLALWISSHRTKSTVGRGKSSKLELHGINKLRALILELAVRGKLVPQNPKDEPASVLLERIAAEKARLVKEKKIKRQKSLGTISDGEKPFGLPGNWEWCRLGEISADIHYGYTASANEHISDVRLLRITDIQDNKVNWNSVPGCQIESTKLGQYQLQNNDILIARTGGTIGKSYLVEGINVCAVFASYLIRVKALDAMYANYIKTFLGSQLYWKQLYANSMGTGQPNVNGNALKSLIFALPPLSEQHRIVTKVDELMALCDQLEQEQTSSISAHQILVETLLTTLTDSKNAEALAENWALVSEHFDTLFTTEDSIDQLKQTILQLAVMGRLVPQNPNDEPASELLERIAAEKARLVKEKKIKRQKPLPAITGEEKPFELPERWEWCRVGTVTLVGTGATPARDNPKYYSPAEVNWVTSGETGNKIISATKEKVSKLAVEETNVSIYPIGTLIVAMYGQGKTRGQVSELMVEAGTNQACAAIQFLEAKKAVPRYVKLYFQKSYEELRTHAAGGAQPNLNVGKIANTVLALPPLPEQHRIVAKVDELMALCDHLKQTVQQAQNTQSQLTDAIVEQALTPADTRETEQSQSLIEQVA